MNRITETELREIARVSLDLAPEPRETLAQVLFVSAWRLSYLLKLVVKPLLAHFKRRE